MAGGLARILGAAGQGIGTGIAQEEQDKRTYQNFLKQLLLQQALRYGGPGLPPGVTPSAVAEQRLQEQGAERTMGRQYSWSTGIPVEGVDLPEGYVPPATLAAERDIALKYGPEAAQKYREGRWAGTSDIEGRTLGSALKGLSRAVLPEPLHEPMSPNAPPSYAADAIPDVIPHEAMPAYTAWIGSQVRGQTTLERERMRQGFLSTVREARAKLDDARRILAEKQAAGFEGTQALRERAVAVNEGLLALREDSHPAEVARLTAQADNLYSEIQARDRRPDTGTGSLAILTDIADAIQMQDAGTPEKARRPELAHLPREVLLSRAKGSMSPLEQVMFMASQGTFGPRPAQAPPAPVTPTPPPGGFPSPARQKEILSDLRRDLASATLQKLSPGEQNNVIRRSSGYKGLAQPERDFIETYLRGREGG